MQRTYLLLVLFIQVCYAAGVSSGSESRRVPCVWWDDVDARMLGNEAARGSSGDICRGGGAGRGASVVVVRTVQKISRRIFEPGVQTKARIMPQPPSPADLRAAPSLKSLDARLEGGSRFPPALRTPSSRAVRSQPRASSRDRPLPGKSTTLGWHEGRGGQCDWKHGQFPACARGMTGWVGGCTYSVS